MADAIDKALSALGSDDDQTITDVDQGARYELAVHIQTKLRESRDVYQLQFLQVYNCLRIMRGIVLSGWEGEGAVEIEGQQTRNLNWPLASALTTNVLAVLQDVYGTAIDAPFTCAAEEMPELPADIREWLQQRLQENLPVLMQMTGGDESKAPQIVQDMFAVAKKQAQQEANDAADQLDKSVKTEVRLGDWEREFCEFLYNYVVYPVAIMKGPFEQVTTVREWDEDSGAAVETTRPVLSVKNISPFMFYPSPNAKCCQSAEYLIHVERYSAVSFSELGKLDGYRASDIDECMIANPDGHTLPYCNDTNIDPTLNPHEWTLGSTPEARGFYDVAQFYGRVSGSCLRDAGIADVKDHEWYEVEADLCDDFLIRVKVKMDGEPDRPFYTTSYQPVTGSIYGESVCSKLFNIQRVAEATIREMMVNLSLSSQPFAEVNMDRIAEDQIETAGELEPGCIKFTKNGMIGDNKPAYIFNTFPSNIEEMQRFMEFVQEQAYEVVGFSKAALGGAPGTVGRTSSGMSIALNQAAKPVKLKIQDIGRRVVKPIVKKYIDAILERNPDPTIRGDIHVYPKGIDGLVDNETKSNNLQMAMQGLAGMAPLLEKGGAPAQMALSLYTEWCKVNAVPLPELGNQDIQNAARQDTGAAYEAQPPAGSPQGQLNAPAPPVPPLDGRSGIAQPSLQAANNLPGTMAR